MYCSSCGVAVTQGLSYCNCCGAKLKDTRGDNAIKSSNVKPELLVSSMAALFILGLVAIAILLGVMKEVVGFDFSILLAVTVFNFILLSVIEGVLIGQLLKVKRGDHEAGDTERLKSVTTKSLGEAQARVLPEPVSSVTEHTTRAFEPIYSERKTK